MTATDKVKNTTLDPAPFLLDVAAVSAEWNTTGGTLKGIADKASDVAYAADKAGLIGRGKPLGTQRDYVSALVFADGSQVPADYKGDAETFPRFQSPVSDGPVSQPTLVAWILRGKARAMGCTPETVARLAHVYSDKRVSGPVREAHSKTAITKAVNAVYKGGTYVPAEPSKVKGSKGSKAAKAKSETSDDTTLTPAAARKAGYVPAGRNNSTRLRTIGEVLDSLTALTPKETAMLEDIAVRVAGILHPVEESATA
jgi:hypothetical protein